MFADKVQIEVRAGKGGDGRLGFRHEKYRAMGGPDGGEGGHGGDIIAMASHNSNTLSKYRTSPRVHAEDGQPGGTNQKAGKAGEDIVINVPVGTLVWDGDTVVCDLEEDGQHFVIAKGGRGGFGNAHFKTSTRQAPRIAEKGEPGEHRMLTLELKLVADVGLIGLPNAGKSTLLSVISNAKPEIGDYAFTTLIPNLGVVDFEDVTFLAADIPGLIEGASEGKGLGDDFLRHIERTSVLLHLIDVHSEDIAADYKTIQAELKAYKVDLSAKPQITVLTKIESVDAATIKKALASLKKVTKYPVFAISAVAHQGLDVLLRAVSDMILADRQARAEIEAALPEVVIDQASFPDMWKLVEEDGKWRVVGERIEGFGRRIDWESRDGVERLRDIMRKMGIGKVLDKKGVEPGTMIHIGDHELEWL
jgi:GTP-binding protein